MPRPQHNGQKPKPRDRITDKEIHEHAADRSFACPCCGGQLTILCTQNITTEESAVMVRLFDEGRVKLATVEEGIEMSKEARDRGFLEKLL